MVMMENCRGVEIRFEHVSFSYPGSGEAVLEDDGIQVVESEPLDAVISDDVRISGAEEPD